MKFKVVMKDPDGVYESISDAVKDSLRSIEGLSDSEREAMQESRHAELSNTLRKWFEYGEYVSVEVDTDAMTATVCEN